MKRWRLGNQRGSVLLAGLILTFVITILGFALFDLAVLENRLVLGSEADMNAFQAAQTGLGRALLVLQQDIINTLGWADGSPAPKNSTVYQALAAGGNCLQGGRDCYTLEVMNVTVAQASTLGVAAECVADSADATYCANIAFIRSRGSSGGPGPTGGVPRTIEALAVATSTLAFTPGVTAGAGSGQAVHGNSLIAGSIRIVGQSGVSSLQFSAAAAGQRNNYADMDAATLNRIARCPNPDPDCPVSPRESLNAVLKVRFPSSPPPAAVVLDPGRIGQATDTAAYPGAAAGKGRVDAVHVAEGCTLQSESGLGCPAPDNFVQLGGSGAVYSDDSTTVRPCADSDCVPDFVGLEVAKPPYDYFACPFSGCAAAGTVFFEAPRAQPLNGLPNDVPVVYTPACALCPATLGALLGTANGLEQSTPDFTAGPVNYTDSAGTATSGTICYRTVGGAKVLEFRVGVSLCTVAGTLAAPQDPLLLYTDGPVRIEAAGSGPLRTINYSGSAIILSRMKTPPTTDHGLKIEGILQNYCPAVPCAPKFPTNDFLAFLAFDDMEVGITQSNIARVMAFFFTEGSMTVRKQTAIVGSVVARKLCFAGGCGDNSGNVPKLFQVPVNLQAGLTNVLPSTEGVGWRVRQKLGFWKECGPTPPAGRC